MNILFSYILLNLLDGERGLFSYFDKVKIEKGLSQKEVDLTEKLRIILLKLRIVSIRFFEVNHE